MKNLALNGKRALVRVDFNVPLDKTTREITDDTRIRAALPTLQYALGQGASLVIMSHLDRPLKKLKEDGTVDTDRFSLRPIADRLSQLLDRPVLFADDCLSEATLHMSKSLTPGQILLVENTRFYPGEEKGDADMAQKLAQLGDVYINDAFGTAHRAHASTATVAQFFAPDARAFGFLMDAEVANGRKILDNPARPLTAIVGGAKVSDKILLLEKLLELANNIIIGGGMAYTFMKAQGGQIGNSLVEADKLDLALHLLARAQEKNVRIFLPHDSVCAEAFSNEAAHAVAPSMSVPDGRMGLDIGPEAIVAFRAVILESATILWNGPMGVFEMPNYARGTQAVAQAVADATALGAYSLIGGGDSVAAITQMNLSDQVSFASTGGGAMLEFLEGKTLPGVAAIAG
jgi:phosphoglycerate kinase